MHAETIELLNVKGKFTSEQAVTLATAIDMGIERAQLVTVPVMDTRFAAVDVRFAAVDARFNQLEAKMDIGFAEMDLKMQRLALKLIIAMLIGQTALGPIGMQSVSYLRQALSTLVR